MMSTYKKASTSSAKVSRWKRYVSVRSEKWSFNLRNYTIKNQCGNDSKLKKNSIKFVLANKLKASVMKMQPSERDMLPPR